MCVAASGRHWEISQPISTKAGDSGLTMDDLYARCKALDGYPDEDGTDARSLLKVYQALGKVESYHWYDGDMEALRLWLLTKGPVFFGAFWTEAMLQPNLSSLLDVSGAFEYGHEVLLIGYDRVTKLFELVNSWGDWGSDGRAWIRDADLERLLANNGDAVGAIEARRPQ